MATNTLSRRPLALLFLLMAAFAVIANPLVLSVPQALAQEKKAEEETPQPADPLLATIHVASFNRVLGDIDYVFESVEQPEFSDFVRAFLANVRDFQGLDHDKAFGVLVFFKPGLSLEPEPVAFTPVSDFDELKKTLQSVNANITEVEGEEDLYQISGNKMNYAKLVKGYAYISENRDALDRDFPNPEERTKKLSEKYDIAAQINIAEIPIGLRTLFLNFLKASSDTELQQRDEESDGQYRLRKANGDASLELVEQLVTHGERITLGAKLDRKGKGLHAELDVQARANSPFAKMLADIGGKRSYFANILDDDVPLSMSVSWQMGSSGKTIAKELISALEAELDKQFADSTDLSQVKSIVTALEATADDGHIDLFAQFRGEKRQGFALIGGVRVRNASALGTGFLPIIKRMKQDPNMAQLDIAVSKHQDVTFHRLVGKQVRPQDQNLYGNQPALYVGAGGQALWFAVGEKPAFETLKKAMDQVADRPKTENLNRKDAPAQLRINVGQWLVMVPDDRPRPFADMAKDTFNADNDMLQLDLRPTENGLRLKFQLQQGFVQLLGKALVKRIERRQGL